VSSPVTSPARRNAPACIVLLATLATPVPAQDVDTDTGLAKAAGWEDVRAHCGSCHSFSLVTNHRASRASWLDMIRWMQRTQNLWELPPETEDTILDYLTENYGPSTSRGRRAPIPPDLLPKTDAPRADADPQTADEPGETPDGR